jgi:hypothetical protein
VRSENFENFVPCSGTSVTFVTFASQIAPLLLFPRQAPMLPSLNVACDGYGVRFGSSFVPHLLHDAGMYHF